MSDRKVIFIMGPGHSGSTLLELILGSHTQISGLGEFRYLPKFIDKQNPEKPDLCGICGSDCKIWTSDKIPILKRYFSKQGRFAYFRRQFSQWHKSIYSHLYEWFETPILVDSSKAVEWIQEQLTWQRHWTDITPIVLYNVRDGRAIVNSIWRKYSNGDFQATVHSWRDQVMHMNKVYEELTILKKQVHYENLATRPSETMQELCEFLGVDFQPEMLAYWKHNHHIIKGNAGTRSLIFKYRTELGEKFAPVEKAGLQHKGYYEQMKPGITLDLRWQNELTDTQLALFETIAGEVNRPFAYNPQN